MDLKSDTMNKIQKKTQANYKQREEMKNPKAREIKVKQFKLSI
jgi:hypothetical protein